MLQVSTFFKFFTAFLFTLSLFAFYSFYVSVTAEDPDKLEAQEYSGSMDLNIPVSHPEIPFNLSGSDTFLLPANPGPANNGGSAGWAMFFDLTANTRNVYVTKMRTASSAGAFVSYSVEVFTRTGTALGGPVGSGPGSSTAGWTSLGTVPVVQGPTASGISDVFYLPPILVPANETVGIAVRFTGAGPRYFGTGTPPLSNYNDTNVSLITGDGRTIPFTPTGLWFSSRALTGEIWYYVESPSGASNNGTEIPDNYSLSQNFPNPFNPVTTIEFAIPVNSHVSLKIFNLNGQEVATLSNEDLSAGTYRVYWNASEYSSGIYFYSITTDRFSQTKKMLLIK